MKYILKYFLLLGVILSFSACEKSLEEVNIDPNNSPSANEANVLTAAEGYIGYIVDADLNANSFIWAQYYTWGVGVSIGNSERFVAQPDDYNGYWSRAYAAALTDLKFLINSEDVGYSGVAKLLSAYVFQGLVDNMGSVPFSEALNGEIADGSVLTPNFDDASKIYSDLIDMVDSGISDLENAASLTSMGQDDLIYGGDISKWQKFANSLKLRLLLRTAEVGTNSDAITSLVAEGNFINSTSDIAAVPFDGQSGDQNPMYARFEFGVGDFYFASNASLNVLNSYEDPRRDAFYSRASVGDFQGQFNGIDQGTVDRDVEFTANPDEYSGSSSLVYGPSLPVILISDWEVNFLRAEAAARYSTADDDTEMFEDAINANFNYFSLDGADNVISQLDYASLSDLDEKLNLIGIQKWVSMNGTQENEGWIEARRFDRPGNRIFTDGIWQTPPLSVLPEGQFPASWLYPSSERSLNPNAPSQRSITDKIFWDN